MRSLVVFSIVGAAVLTAVLLLAITLAPPQATATTNGDGNHLVIAVEDHAIQVDLGHGPFKPGGKAGSFKLLGDFSPGGIDSAHVAVSNVNCNVNGTSPLAVLFANAQVGAPTPINLIRLNSTNMITDVSFPGLFCTYHVNTTGVVENQNTNIPQAFFRITDIAIVNTDAGASVQPHPTASAKLHVRDCAENFAISSTDSVPFIPCGGVYPFSEEIIAINGDNHFLFGIEDHAIQADLAHGPFKPGGQAGSFKLLGDFSPGGIDSAHVAVSNVNCNKAGTSPLAVLFANAQVGAPTPVNIVRLNSSNMITDVSFKGQFCTYHVDTFGIVENQNTNIPQAFFRITDIVIVNTNQGASVQPHPVSSATLHVTDCGARIDGVTITNRVPVIPCGDVFPTTLTLIKNVTNDNGGDAEPNDFGLTIDGNLVASGDPITITPNKPHTIDEDGLSGYSFVSITGDPECPAALGGTITLASGESATCTITNDDEAPTLTIIKDPTNDDGGNALPDDFGLTVGGNPVFSGVAVTLDANTTYGINETLVDGYTFVSITGDPECPAALGGNVTLDEGEDITCTITNDDIAPTITLIKFILPNGDGADVNDFGLTIGGTPVSSGQTLEVDANAPISIDEFGLLDYDFVSITGDPECPAFLGGTVTLDEGEDITCTITNEFTGGGPE